MSRPANASPNANASSERARVLSRGEKAADGLVHGAGLLAAVAGVLVLAVSLDPTPRGIATVAAYSAGLLGMLSLSAAYNLFSGERSAEILRRLDHAGIFLMIAGTYTPFTVLGLSGGWSVGMTALVWAIAGLGVAMKLTLPSQRYPVASALLYLAFGWLGLVALGPLIDALPPTVLILVGAGGLVYSLGVIFHALQRLPYQRAIWHGFVVAAAAIHYVAVSQVVLAA